jgi:hypothetical protein
MTYRLELTYQHKDSPNKTRYIAEIKGEPTKEIVEQHREECLGYFLDLNKNHMAGPYKREDVFSTYRLKEVSENETRH